LKSIISSLDRAQPGFALLAPCGISAPSVFRAGKAPGFAYDLLLAEMQRFRGSVYVDDGAISQADLTADGRHSLGIDRDSWHLLALDAYDRVCGCVRILDRTDARSLDDLWIRNSALAESREWGGALRAAIAAEIDSAHREGLRFGEVGGLAMAPETRCTMTSLRTILGAFGLLQLLGGAKCVVTATARHGCAQLLRRIGLAPLAAGGVDLPQYPDPQYGCEMRVLRFDSRFPAPKYLQWVAELTAYLRTVPVIFDDCRAPAPAPAPRVMRIPAFPFAAAWSAAATA
jgi:hypothetical protein